MSYTRVNESNHYIYPTSESVVFDFTKVDNDAVDIFLYKLYKFRRKEFKQRINHGKSLINEHKIDDVE